MTTKDLKEPDFWLKAVDKYGFPTVATIVLGYILWSLGSFVAAGHVKFLDATIDISKQQVEVQRGIAEGQKTIADGQRELRELTLENTLILRDMKGQNKP